MTYHFIGMFAFVAAFSISAVSASRNRATSVTLHDIMASSASASVIPGSKGTATHCDATDKNALAPTAPVGTLYATTVLCVAPILRKSPSPVVIKSIIAPYDMGACEASTSRRSGADAGAARSISNIPLNRLFLTFTSASQFATEHALRIKLSACPLGVVLVSTFSSRGTAFNLLTVEKVVLLFSVSPSPRSIASSSEKFPRRLSNLSLSDDPCVLSPRKNISLLRWVTFLESARWSTFATAVFPSFFGPSSTAKDKESALFNHASYSAWNPSSDMIDFGTPCPPSKYKQWRTSCFDDGIFASNNFINRSPCGFRSS